MFRSVILALAALSAAAEAAAARPGDTAARSPCGEVSFEGDRFMVCRYDPATNDLRLMSRGQGGPVGSLPRLGRILGPAAADVVFAMNAGMYDRDRHPVGLFVERGHTTVDLNLRKGAGNFYLLPNGVFWVGKDRAPHVDESVRYGGARHRAVWATQSGPLLVEDGVLNSRIAADGPSTLVRNGVGVKGAGAYFVISEGKVSFGRFARFFRDRLACPNALYLDGTVSSLWVPTLGRMDGREDLGTFVVVLRRRP